MKTDGIFRLHQFRVTIPYNGLVRLIPFGDVHHDSPAHSADKWNEFCEHCKRGNKDNLYLGMGDYLDSFSCSERIIMGNPAIHESTRKRMAKEAEGRVQAIYKTISFMRGRVIGLLGGNHYIEFPDGTTSDMLLARKLDTTYLGACAAIRLSIAVAGHHGDQAVDIFAHHGRGTGTTPGGSLNAVDRLSKIAECDIYLMGDNHQRGAIPVGERLWLDKGPGDNLQLRSRRAFIGRTGSFLRAYVDGESNYVVDRALPPASLGWIEFHLRVKRDQSNNRDHNRLEIQVVQ